MSPAPARTSRAAIIAAARALLEAGGLDSVSMAAVAERVGVRPPSLYKHFDDRGRLLAAVATDVALDLGAVLAAAAEGSGVEPSTRLRAIAIAYRAFALATPRGTALLFAGVAPGSEPSLESQVEAARPVLELAESIVGRADSLSAARAVTAFAHGFTSMEAAGAFRLGGDVEEAYRLGISVLVIGLAGVASAAPDGAVVRE